MRFYHGHKTDGVGITNLFLTPKEANHIGLSSRLVLKPLPEKRWLLTTDEKARARLNREHNSDQYRVTFMGHNDLPATGRTTLPYSETANGLVLRPMEAEIMPIRHPKQPRSVSKSPADLATLESKVGSDWTERDLREGLKLIAQIAKATNAELFIDSDGRLRARVVRVI